MGLSVRSSGKPLGHEICGVDLAANPGADVLKEIERVLVENSVVVLRNQTLTPEQHVRFSKYFGEQLEVHVGHRYALSGYPEVHVVSNIVENGRNIGVSDAGLTWHSDICYKAVTAKYSLFHALEVPVIDGIARGDTSFASTVAAYDALPEARKRELEGLRAIYRYSAAYAKRMELSKDLPPLTDAQKKQTPDVTHPIIRTHPISGKKCIYLSENLAIGVVDMPEKEGMQLINELLEHSTRPEFVYVHKWRVGDFVIWDNCSSLHRANLTDYTLPHRRRMHRVTVMGSAPY